MDKNQKIEKNKEYQSFALKRGLLAIALVIALVWGLAAGLNYLDMPRPLDTRVVPPSLTPHEGTDVEKPAGHQQDAAAELGLKSTTAANPEANVLIKEEAGRQSQESSLARAGSEDVMEHQGQAQARTEAVDKTPDSHTPAPVVKEQPAGGKAAAPTGEQTAAGQHTAAPGSTPDPIGVAFVDSLIEPLDYELNHRFWGWRPNDIVNITDNVNNFQLGVLEVTRRSVVQLAERISRTGSTASFNPHVENAMNWVMVKANRYWFPAPESKYKESLAELKHYRRQLIQKSASFYTRTDNLIPLLAAYEDLLGSCDENLVKYKEGDGSKVSYFSTDDYFYYAKGVASALTTILEAVHHDFEPTLEGRHATELLHHALESCKRAAALDPWIITNGSLEGILANHRANIAAPISHARFYMEQLVKTLST